MIKKEYRLVGIIPKLKEIVFSLDFTTILNGCYYYSEIVTSLRMFLHIQPCPALFS